MNFIYRLFRWLFGALFFLPVALLIAICLILEEPTWDKYKTKLRACMKMCIKDMLGIGS